MLKMAENSAEERRKRARLGEARNEKSSYEQRKAQKESKRNVNEKKIERLKSTKDSLQSLKKSAEEHHRSLKKYTDDNGIQDEWVGNKQKDIVSMIDGDLVSYYKSYTDRLDDVVDAICDEITRLQNENMQLGWDILHIGSLINSLVNEIRTLCN